MLLNSQLLGLQGAQIIGMPDAGSKPQLKAAIAALLMDRSMLGAAIDEKIDAAVKKLPASSGMNASSVDAKIKTAVEGKLSAANLGKMRLAPASGGGRRGSKRSKRSGSKRGTKRR